MTRDEIEQQVKKYFDKLPYPENWEIVEFALSIHDEILTQAADIIESQVKIHVDLQYKLACKHNADWLRAQKFGKMS